MSDPAAEFRKCPILERWVIMAPGRALRPGAFVGEASPAALVETSAQTAAQRADPAAPPCPFCEGAEALTPRETLALAAAPRPPDGPGWLVRVVPNKYPAVEPPAAGEELAARARGCPAGAAGAGLAALPQEQSLGDRPARPAAPTADSEEAGRRGTGLQFTAWPARGVHELVIESPRHFVKTAHLGREQFERVIAAYVARIEALGRQGRWPSVVLFKNEGAAAGASLAHVHAQLVASALPPAELEAEWRATRQRQAAAGTCPFCELIERELAEGVRVVACSPRFVALSAYAARLPFETWILPREHEPRFEALDAGLRGELARLWLEVLVRLERLPSRPALNYWVHSAPFDSRSHEHYHWHVEIVPRVAMTAGFEWGTGCYVNPVLPEQAAALLRSSESESTSSQTLPIS